MQLSNSLVHSSPNKQSGFRWLKTTLLALFIAQLNIPAFAVDWHPDVKAKLIERGELQSQYHALNEARHAGVCSPADVALRTPNMIRKMGVDALGSTDGSDATLARTLATSAQTIDTVRVLVILVDFADNPYDESKAPYSSSVSATIPMFDSVLFSTGNLDGGGITNPTGSMTEYYMENSYGNFFIEGTVVGWYRMPLTYAEYVGSNNGLQQVGTNARDLARHAIDAADPFVNYKDFDNYGPGGTPDNLLDGVFIVHAGTGNEESHVGGLNDIHSHKWSLRQTISKDGVIIDNYTMEPEESYIGNSISPIGVFAHEYGHFIGLPDLYDTDGNTEPVEGSSDGLGVWSIMASGNYLGGSSRPSHLDAWSKTLVGFMTPTVVTENMRDVQIPQASDSAVCYKLVGSNLPDGEYFLVENRQKVNFDLNLPGAGLLVYHVDEAFNSNFLVDNNNNESRYLVALEQADGQNNLALTLFNDGDAGDPFSANNNYTEFSDMGSPDSKANGTFATTEVAVWNISEQGPVMSANLDISFSRPYLSLAGTQFYDLGNGDFTLDEGEDFELDVWVDNLWANGANGYVILSSPSADLNITTDSIFLGEITGAGGTTGTPIPFVFSVANSLEPSIDSLYFTFHSDDGANVSTLGIEIEIGAPQILIVNSDQNGANGEFYAGDVYSARKPSRSHVVFTEGAVSGALLNQYNTVIWFFGDSTDVAPPASDIAAMKSFLDGGGNLMLSGQNLTPHLHNMDSAFFANYLHAAMWSDVKQYHALQEGVTGSPITDGYPDVRIFGNNGAMNWRPGSARAVRVLDGALPALRGRSAPAEAFHALSFSGTYKVVFFSLPFEAIENVEGVRAPRAELLSRTLDFFGGLQTDVEDPFGDDPILPQSFTLNQNYPNPFNPTTTISYSIDQNAAPRSANRTELIIYNILGQEIRSLVSLEQGPGEYSVVWDGRSESGSEVSSGVYFYRLKRGEISQSRKMVLLK